MRSVATKPPPTMGQDRSLLLVDDEPHLCESLKRTLRGGGYVIHTANSADDALAVLAANPVHVIVSDQQMPGRKGTELLNEVKNRFPETVRMILSGTSEVADVAEAMETGAIYKFLTKPIDPILLRANVSEAFARVDSLSARRGAVTAAYSSSATNWPLTRIQLDQVYPEIVARAEATGARVGLLMLQTDQYQSVVGSFGYAFAGDFMTKVAGILEKCGRTAEPLAEISPGTHSIVTLAVDPERRFNEIKARLKKGFLEPIVVHGHSIRVTFSLGGTIAQDGGAEFEELVDQANSAAVAASQRGGATLLMYSRTLVTESRQQLHLESELRKAVTARTLRVFYQPQVDVGTGTIVGLEALVRWPHPEHGFVSPGYFIPIAERIGLIREIGDCVIREALRQYKSWQRRGFAPTELAINVSPMQLRDSRFADSVGAHLREAGIKAEQLVLEITESAAMAVDDVVARTVDGLRDRGIRLAIDDFGTGYANLGQLSGSAFSKLKVDRSLIPNGHDGRREVLFASIIAMARELDLSVVAEGVETPTQLACVVASGCRVVQGYFYSPPISGKRMDSLLAFGFSEESGR